MGAPHIRIVVTLTDEESERLEALARAKGTSREEAIRAMIRSAQPGGSGWTHPAVKKSEPPKKL